MMYRYLQVLMLVALISYQQHMQPVPTLPVINEPHEVWALFAVTPEELNQRTQAAIDEVDAALQEIFSVPAHERTFANTCRAIDAVTYGSSLAVLQNVTRIC